MTVGTGDFELTMDELRVVARFVVEAAEEVLPVFEAAHPDDPRPRAAVDAAWEFVNGAKRTNLQRAAREAATESGRLAARTAGDAAAAAYLHPIAKATQVSHILRGPASAARIAELVAADNPEAGDNFVERAKNHATPVLIDVLSRYPNAPEGKSRVDHLMSKFGLQATRIPLRVRVSRQVGL
ncbi:putative immunity protein [Cryobacterium sp. Y62]|uniref:putative immunity protein n=1 Tax=Cryobacterium sp. Y62 TaxID=2048284 RepID=UPI0018ED3B18|nr:exonuclease SbcC [Cryobacterium sp. Y62]